MLCRKNVMRYTNFAHKLNFATLDGNPAFEDWSNDAENSALHDLK